MGSGDPPPSPLDVENVKIKENFLKKIRGPPGVPLPTTIFRPLKKFRSPTLKRVVADQPKFTFFGPPSLFRIFLYFHIFDKQGGGGGSSDPILGKWASGKTLITNRKKSGNIFRRNAGYPRRTAGYPHSGLQVPEDEVWVMAYMIWSSYILPYTTVNYVLPNFYCN